MIFVKQSTTVTLVLGPFVDQTDGFTAETGLTIAQADVRLSKNGAAFAQKNDVTSATSMENGNYSCPVNATDTNTLGVLRAHVNASGALPVWEDLMVMPANAWDSLFGADLLQVDVQQWIGAAPNALVSGRVDASAGAMAAGVVTAAAVATGAIDADALAADAVAEIADGVWDEDATGHQTQGTFGQAIGDPGADADTIYALTNSLQADTDDIQSRLPAALVSGRIDASVGAIAAAAITAAAIAADAISAAKLAADAANKIADHVLRRTYANARASADGDAVNFRSLLGAIGKLVNKWSISGATLTVYQEDDLTSTAPGGTQALTGTAGADPITAVDTT